MSLATEIIDYIAAQTALTEGVDLFYTYMPRDKETGVIISEIGGTENDTNMYRKLFHIISVGANPVSAEAICTQVLELFTFCNGIQLASKKIFNGVSMASPQFLHMAKDNYPVYTASFVLFTER